MPEIVEQAAEGRFFHIAALVFQAQNERQKRPDRTGITKDFERTDIMKKDELQKLGLDEEAAKKVEAASAEELKGYIPKARFDEVNAEKGTLQTSLKERDAQLEALKAASGDADALKAQIVELQAANALKDKAHADEIKELKINAAVEAALITAKAKNAKAAKALLDLEKAELADDGTVKGLADQIKKLQGAEDSKFLFEETKKPAIKGAKPGETGNEDLDNRVDVSKMTYEELAAYMEANPDAKI
jgi:hypothetical protein